MIELKLNNQRVLIDAGELVSYTVGDYEYIHQKGNPGWSSSDTEMFPIIGPTAKANFKVRTPKGNAIQDQHGLLRQMPYDVIEESHQSAIFQKTYKANTKVKNSKFPEKSTVRDLFWPYDFQFQKIFFLKEDGLEISFKVSAEEGMPFMLGFHPTFKTDSNRTKIEITDTKSATVKDIIAAGSEAYQVANITSVLLLNNHPIRVSTQGFGHFMLWTEVDNMVCIEPITFYPCGVTQDKLWTGFSKIGKVPEVFGVFIEPIVL